MKKFIDYSLLSVVLFLLATVGCSNFLNGSDLKSEIDKQIDYAKNRDGLHVVSKSPEYSVSGVFKNSAICISFDNPILTSSFSFTVLNSKNQDVSDHYQLPVFTENNKSVSIKNILPIDVENGMDDLTVIISKGLCGEMGGRLGVSDYSWQFKVNNLTDRDAPEISDFRIYKSRYLMDKGKSFTEKDWHYWTIDDVELNHAGVVQLYCKGYDKDSEISSINITETVVAKYESLLSQSYRKIEEVTSDVTTYSTSFNDCFTKIPGTSYSDAFLTYEFKSVDYATGIVKLTVDVLDSFNNKASYCYYIAKDRDYDYTLPGMLCATDYNTTGYASTPFTTSSNATFTDSEISAFSKRVYNYVSDVNYAYACDSSLSDVAYNKINDALVKIEWGNAEGDYVNATDFISRKDMEEAYSNNVGSAKDYLPGQMIYFDLPGINPSKNVYYKTTVQLSCGREVSVTGIKAAAPEIISAKYTSSGLEVKVAMPASEKLDRNYDCVYRIWYKEKNKEKYECSYCTTKPYNGVISLTLAELLGTYNQDSSEDIDFYIQSCLTYKESDRDNYNSGFALRYMHGQVSKKVTIAKNTSYGTLSTTPNITNVQINSLGVGSGLLCIEFTSNAKNMDRQWIEAATKENGSTETYLFDSDNKCSFIIETDVLYNKEWPYRHYFSKNGSIGSVTHKIDQNTNTTIEYNAPPKFPLDYYGIDDQGQYLTCKVPVTNNKKGLKASGGKVEVKVWYHKLSGQSDPLNSNYSYNVDKASTLKKSGLLTDADIRKFDKKTITFNVGDAYMKVPVSDFDDTVNGVPYLLCFEVTDSSGNVACEPCFYFHKRKSTQTYTIDNGLKYDNNYSSIDYIVSSAPSSVILGSLYSFNTSSGKWVKEFDNQYFKSHYSSGKYVYWLHYQPAYAKSTELKGFLRFNLNGANIGTGGSGSGSAYDAGAYKVDENGAFLTVKSKPSSWAAFEDLDTPICNLKEIYNYAPAYYYGGFLDGKTCSVKKMTYGVSAAFVYYQRKNGSVSLLTGDDEVFIDHDWPVFVEVLTSNKNWSEGAKTDKDAVVNWEIHASEAQNERINPKVIFPSANETTTYSYYPIDKSKIPANNYYVVVTYFADGTSAITDVRKK